MFKRFRAVTSLIVMLLSASMAFAQPIGEAAAVVPVGPIKYTGSVTSAANVVTWKSQNYQSAQFAFTSVGSGNSFIVEQSFDNSTWHNTFGTSAAAAGGWGAGATSVNNTAVYTLRMTAPFYRLRVSTYGSGTVTAYVVLSNVQADPGAVTVQTANAATPLSVAGNVAAGATDSGNPVKTGCIYETTPTVVTNGQRSNVQCGQRGNVSVSLWNSAGNAAAQTSGTLADGTANALGTLNTTGQNMRFNGSTWDREFICPLSAQVTATAAATTQIVALASSQIIRVCSYQVGISATGTFSFVYGTGANCGSGTTTITPATTLTTGNVVTRFDHSGALRTAASNALCVAAVGGNAQVHITYAQY